MGHTEMVLKSVEIICSEAIFMLTRNSHRRLEGHLFQVRHKLDWGQGFILLLPQTAVLPKSNAGSDVVKPASSFVIQIVRPCAPWLGYAIRTWSAVRSEAPHSQFSEGERPHLCMDEWNRPTAIRRRLSLTQAVWGKLIPTGLVSVLGIKHKA